MGAAVDVSAHGLGGGADLPIPASFAVAGGTAALTVSFLVLLLAWRRARYADAEVGLVVPRALAVVIDHPALRVAVRTIGLAVAAFAAWAAVAGEDLLTNPVFGLVYVWLWVGIVPVSLLLGPVVSLASPARTIHLILARATGGDPDQGIATMPSWLGYWPAAIGLFAFVWLELVYPEATYLGPLRLWFALYLAATVIGAAVFGASWLSRADPFEVYANLVSRLSVWGRRADGTLIMVSPLRNMTGLRGDAGLVAVVAVLLGSTAFDSFRESVPWVRFSQRTMLDNTALDTGVLLAACALVGATFFVSVAAAGPGNDGTPRRHMPRQLAASIVPVIVGYMVAHYLTLFVEVGQQTLVQVSDPLSNGSDLFGTSGWGVSYFLSTNPTLLATIKVLAIVVGHVLGVIVAHDRSLQLLPSRRHLVGQLPLLGAMTLYTFTGLYLLFGL